MIFAFTIIILFFIVLAFRIGWIQVVATEKYAGMAAETQIKDETIAPQRGSILDRNMKELAVSTASYRVWMRMKPYNWDDDKGDKEKLAENQNNAISILAKSLKMKEEEIRAMFPEGKNRARIAKDVTKEQIEKIRAGINDDEKGTTLIEIEDDSRRNYPMGTLAASVIGSLNNDRGGQTGIELEYDEYLSGVDGRRISSTDREGNELTSGSLQEYASRNGMNVVLTIDETIQYYAEQVITKYASETMSDQMTCIVLDPKTGEVLAMASSNTYDPANPGVPITKEAQEEFAALSDEGKSEYLSKMWRNSNISDVYDPGSVFKLITTSSAIEEGVITPESHFNCSGSYQVYDREIKCWNYPQAHGNQTVREAVLNSCNPAMIQIIQAMGEERFYDYMELYGITTKTGIDLPAEGGPLIQSRDTVGPVGLATMAFGQGLSVTPIQMISAVSAIANDGKLMRPHVVKSFTDAEGKVVEKLPTKIDRQVISSATSLEMKEIMNFASENSPNPVSRIEGYRVGIKTGTTQKLIDGEYGDAMIGSMVMVAPIDDPQFVVLVVADNPKVGEYGIGVTGPAVNDIARELLRYMGIRPTV